MSTLSKAERDKLAESDFAQPAQRLLPILDADDLAAVDKLLSRVKDPVAVKSCAVAIAKRRNLKLPDTWAAEFAVAEQRERDYFTVEFSLAGEATASTDGKYVTRKAPLIFKAGEYPAKQYAMTPEELALAAAEFQAVPLKLEHKDTVLDGKLGELSAVELSDDFGTLSGTVRLKKWLDAELGATERKLSASWHRPTKRMKELSLVLNPHLTEAALEAAFSKAEGGKGEPDATADMASKEQFTSHGRGALQEIHDMAAQRGAHCGDAAMSAEVLFTLPAEAKHLQSIHDAAKKGGAMCRVYGGDKGSAMMSNDPATVALQRELEDERKKRQDAEQKRQEAERRSIEAEAAAAFAAENAADRTTPAQRNAEVAEYMQAALDDAASPAVSFGMGKTRVQAVKDRWAARPKLGLRKELVPGADFAVLPNGDAGDDKKTEEKQLKERATAMALAHNKRNGKQ